jgi:uncharacterized protein (DUF1778 family)
MNNLTLTHFTQTNVVAVLERANEILHSLRALSDDVYQQQMFVDLLISKAEAGDEWERASLMLAKVELFEVAVRMEDISVEKFPADWNGGLPKMW